MIKSDTLAARMLEDYEHFDEYVERLAKLMRTVNGIRFPEGILAQAVDAYLEMFEDCRPYLSGEEFEDMIPTIRTDILPHADLMIEALNMPVWD